MRTTTVNLWLYNQASNGSTHSDNYILCRDLNNFYAIPSSSCPFLPQLHHKFQSGWLDLFLAHSHLFLIGFRDLVTSSAIPYSPPSVHSSVPCRRSAAGKNAPKREVAMFAGGRIQWSHIIRLSQYAAACQTLIRENQLYCQDQPTMSRAEFWMRSAEVETMNKALSNSDYPIAFGPYNVLAADCLEVNISPFSFLLSYPTSFSVFSSISRNCSHYLIPNLIFMLMNYF